MGAECYLCFPHPPGRRRRSPEASAISSPPCLLRLPPAEAIVAGVSVPEFAAAVQTKKLTVEGGEVTRSSNPWRHILPSSADVTEEIMLSPGGKLEWLFVAEHAGDFGIACAVPGHAKAGMAGKVRIES